jgi:RimJ/RimL family protein N-acetyltransferase
MGRTLPERDEIRHPRLRLRRLRASDAGLLALYASDARVARMTMNIPHPYPPGGAEAYLARLERFPDEETWAIDAGEEGENGFVGVISFKPRGPDSAEVGYWVAPAFWGAGYASGAVAALAEEARERGFRELTAQVFHDNDASVRVLMRCGFEYTGDGEGFSVARGGVVATHRYRRALAVAG